MLDRLTDSLELLAGEATIHTVRWGAGWDVPRDQVLSLDPSLHLRGILENGDFMEWCNAGSGGSPGALGNGCLSPWYDVDPRSDRPFLDIAATGSRFYEIEAGDALERLPLTDFQVKYFGATYTRLWVATNGWLSLAGTRPTTDPTAPTPIFPRSLAEGEELEGPVIAPFWNRLSCGETCRIFYERREVAEREVLIVQWQDFHLGEDAAGSVTFQLQLWEDGDLVVAFGPIDNPHRQGSETWALYEGNDAWIGLVDAAPTVFLTAHYKQPLGLDGRSIHFRPK